MHPKCTNKSAIRQGKGAQNTAPVLSFCLEHACKWQLKTDNQARFSLTAARIVQLIRGTYCKDSNCVSPAVRERQFIIICFPVIKKDYLRMPHLQVMNPRPKSHDSTAALPPGHIHRQYRD
jgi:hypothetical protein